MRNWLHDRDGHVYAHPIFLHPCAVTINASQIVWGESDRETGLINVVKVD